METLRNTKLWYTQPAQQWCQGMPIGNGRIGAMVLGDPRTEVLYVNEDTLWSGKPYVSPRKESHRVFDTVRELTLAGKCAQAAELAALEFGDHVAQMYMPLGNIELSFSGEETIENYTRVLDMENGIVTVRYTAGGVTYTRELFVSHPDQVLVCRVSTDVPGSLSCGIRLKGALRCTEGQEDGCLTLEGNCPNYAFVRGSGERVPERYIYGEKPEDKGVGYRAMLHAHADGGEVVLHDGEIRVSGAQSVELRFAVRTSFAGWNKLPAVEGVEYENACRRDLAAAAAQPYETLKRRHMDDASALFDRVTLTLPRDENEDLPTDERLLRHGAGEPDRGLYALLFQFGRYLTIASSRPGTQVTNLQGIWNYQIDPPWGCNCTININTEMNYWPTLRCGLAECYEPLISMVKDLAKAGAATARDYYDAPGFVCHSATDLWRLSHPQNNGIPGSAMWGFWNGSSGWLCRMLWDYYAFTGDRAYLEEIWPVLLAGAVFYRHLLMEKDGELILPACTSPENNYLIDGEPCPVDVTTEMSMAICRDLFRCVADAAQILGKPEGAEYASLLPRLRPMQIMRDGRINEWYTEHEDWEEHHRHISHLYGLFPGREKMSAEQLAAAAKVLEVRGDASTGWSVAWKANCWARLGDGEHAERVLDIQLRPVAGTEDISCDGGTFLSMLCAHPPFQIDGNFGAASAVAQMLVRTEGDAVELLPALPRDWDCGSVSGLALHGGGKIDFAWENGRVTSCRITGGTNAYRVTQGADTVAYMR